SFLPNHPDIVVLRNTRGVTMGYSAVSLKFLTIAALVATALLAGSPLTHAESFTFTQIDVPGASFTQANDVNDARQIVGIYYSGDLHSFFYSDGTLTMLDVPGATSTFASGINNMGQIVGTYDDSTGTHGFLYSGGSFTQLDVPGATVTRANGINDVGQ